MPKYKRVTQTKRILSEPQLRVSLAMLSQLHCNVLRLIMTPIMHTLQKIKQKKKKPTKAILVKEKKKWRAKNHLLPFYKSHKVWLFICLLLCDCRTSHKIMSLIVPFGAKFTILTFPHNNLHLHQWTPQEWEYSKSLASFAFSTFQKERSGNQLPTVMSQRAFPGSWQHSPARLHSS